MARQRKTAGSSRKTATRKSSSSSRKAGTARKTASNSRKKTTTSRKSGTARKTASSRKTSGSRKTSSRKSGGAKKSSTGRKASSTRKTASSRKTSGSRKTSSSRKSGGAKKATARRASRAAAARKPVQLGSLDDVLKEQIEDLYSAEKQLVEALPKVARAAAKPALKDALENHLEETRGHVLRLESIFGRVGISSPSEHCDGMEGLISEGEGVVEATGDPAAKDAALIAAAQRVEHYEIAGYGTARTLAGELGLDEVRDVLSETLDEEKNADSLLNTIATGGTFGTGVNEQAAGQNGG